MIDTLETIILSTAQTIYDAWSSFGVAMLLAFENATGITPSEIIPGVAGWLLISEHQLPPSVIPVGCFYTALGSVLGASPAYWVARLGGCPLVDRLARWLRINSAHIDRAENQFHHWGAGLVLVGRVIPGVRTLVSIPEGLARMPVPTFFVATFIGAGYVLGYEWVLISTYVQLFFPYLLVGGGGVLALLLVHPRRLVPSVVPVCVYDD